MRGPSDDSAFGKNESARAQRRRFACAEHTGSRSGLSSGMLSAMIEPMQPKQTSSISRKLMTTQQREMSARDAWIHASVHSLEAGVVVLCPKMNNGGTRKSRNVAGCAVLQYATMMNTEHCQCSVAGLEAVLLFWCDYFVPGLHTKNLTHREAKDTTRPITGIHVPRASSAVPGEAKCTSAALTRGCTRSGGYGGDLMDGLAQTMSLGIDAFKGFVAARVDTFKGVHFATALLALLSKSGRAALGGHEQMMVLCKCLKMLLQGVVRSGEAMMTEWPRNTRAGIFWFSVEAVHEHKLGPMGLIDDELRVLLRGVANLTVRMLEKDIKKPAFARHDLRDVARMVKAIAMLPPLLLQHPGSTGAPVSNDGSSEHASSSEDRVVAQEERQMHEMVILAAVKKARKYRMWEEDMGWKSRIEMFKGLRRMNTIAEMEDAKVLMQALATDVMEHFTELDWWAQVEALQALVKNSSDVARARPLFRQLALSPCFSDMVGRAKVRHGSVRESGGCGGTMPMHHDSTVKVDDAIRILGALGDLGTWLWRHENSDATNDRLSIDERNLIGDCVTFVIFHFYHPRCVGATMHHQRLTSAKIAKCFCHLGKLRAGSDVFCDIFVQTMLSELHVAAVGEAVELLSQCDHTQHASRASGASPSVAEAERLPPDHLSLLCDSFTPQLATELACAFVTLWGFICLKDVYILGWHLLLSIVRTHWTRFDLQSKCRFLWALAVNVLLSDENMGSAVAGEVSGMERLPEHSHSLHSHMSAFLKKHCASVRSEVLRPSATETLRGQVALSCMVMFLPD